jgi:acetyltransferase-like isoleucine patch superfamily enzyme
MSDSVAIRIPQEFVNDDTVKLMKWLVDEGQEILQGQPLLEIETSKAVVEIAALENGKVFARRKVGEEVHVGEVVGYISANGRTSDPIEISTAHPKKENEEGHKNTVEQLSPDARFSNKAADLLRRQSISPAYFVGKGLVCEKDVLEYLDRTSAPLDSTAPLHPSLEGLSLDRITLPSAFSELQRGKLEPSFLSELKRNPDIFAKLSNAEKCETYRSHGAIIGREVVLGEGAILIAPQIVVGDQVKFGANTSIQCRERFLAGQMTSFRADLSVQGGTVVFGENMFGGTKVRIGGGGSGDPFAIMVVGDGTYIGDDVFINICRPVVIGREVFLTQRSILVTHNIGHSILEGYENRFSPIVLEDYSQVGMNSTIYAGSRVGQGSIVMSNSYLVSSVPPGKMAGGVPAKVIRDAARPPDRKRRLEIVQTMIAEFHELLSRKGNTVSPLGANSRDSFYVEYQDKTFRLAFREDAAIAELNLRTADESVVWTFSPLNDALPSDCIFMDLLGKRIQGGGGIFARTAREFLRKRGIRLEPGPWRYTGGLI